MKIAKKTVGFAATTAALLIAGCAGDKEMSNKSMSDNSMGQCHGVNSCKGSSACATAESTCKGNNSCKGKGWVAASKANCDAKGGKFTTK